MIKRAVPAIFLVIWCFIASGKPSAAAQDEAASTTGSAASQAATTSTTENSSATGKSEATATSGNHSTAQSAVAATNDANIYASIAPPFFTPGKNLFVTREGDPFVVTVTSTCFLEDESESQFELLSPTPDFIQVSESYRREIKTNGYAEGIGIVYVTPQIGDAGKYTVTLQVKACNGRVERVISFRVHVKPAS